MDKQQLFEEARLHAESRMGDDWNRKNEIFVGVFYTYFMDYVYDKMSNQWVSVKDRPLYTMTDKGWECTEDGNRDFIAAVPFEQTHPDGSVTDEWWLRHCCFEDETGLHVVGDDENYPAGWEHDSITHYIPMPKPPQTNNQ